MLISSANEKFGKILSFSLLNAKNILHYYFLYFAFRNTDSIYFGQYYFFDFLIINLNYDIN